jgi:hypothetical protein
MNSLNNQQGNHAKLKKLMETEKIDFSKFQFIIMNSLNNQQGKTPKIKKVNGN